MVTDLDWPGWVPSATMDERRTASDATAEAAAVDPGYAFAERVRGATFKQARRGYDRREVDEFLARPALTRADW